MTVSATGASAGIQRFIFQNLKKIPAVRRKVDEEVKKAEKVMKQDIKALYQGDKDDVVFITDLPSSGLTAEEILSRIENEYLDLGKTAHN